MKKRLKICYILSYHAPNYIRTQALLAALKKINKFELYYAINTTTKILRYWQTIYKLIKIRIKYNPDYYILGFRGHEIFFIVRLLTYRKILIFDSFVSPSDALINENKFGFIGKLLGSFIFIIEKLILKYSDHILTDTKSHQKLFINKFNLAENKITSLYLGAAERAISQIKINKKEPFAVLFYGSFLPLHGMNVIIKAISLLKDTPIQFTIIGGKGKFLKDFLFQKKLLGLNNINHIKWADFDTICDRYIANADICLGGPFGNTNQAQRVITGKTFQSLAMKKPVIIGRTNELVGFKDKQNCLIIEQANPQQLSQAIRWSYTHQDKLHDIGLQGYKLYQEKFSISTLSNKIKVLIDSKIKKLTS